jgi:YHS domain-containing protein
MKMKNFAIILLFLTVAACNQPKKAESEKKPEMPVAQKDSAKKDLAGLAFAVKKDLVCGMPVSAGVHDTAQYKGKIYGFCAAECKAEFVKDPGSYLSAK